MEPPSSFSASAIQNEQVKVLEAVPPLSKGEVMNNTVRGQYAGGTMSGKRVPAYRDESMVAPDSNTETYVALKLTIDNWRWAGVPFYIRTGKRLAKRKSEIVIQFRKAPLALFRKSAATLPTANRLVMRIQPAESISLQFEAKVPGPVVETRPVEMLFCYEDYFGRANRTGYETLLYDAMVGDSSLFKRADMIEAGWAIIQPVLDQWSQGKDRNWHLYEAGSEGPAEADQLIERDGRHWLPIADALEASETRIPSR
jgi:glucose-6-phosphate 1-dehydrogenase